MEPFIRHKGTVVPLDKMNVDTDAIVPKQFLKRVERTGFGAFLFYEWRFDLDGQPIGDFVLNQPKYEGASILLTGANFGCGSSREHAPWALADYGFKVIIAPSFADIFYNNCFNNGILPITLDPMVIDALFERCRTQSNFQLTVDLEGCTLYEDDGASYTFELDAFRRDKLLTGQDDIDLTLTHLDAIKSYESRRSTQK